MDLAKVVAQLREELANLDAAILSLERLQHESGGGGRRRGRPPKAPSDIRGAARSEPGEGSGEPPSGEDV
jgi:hypothetical protein